MFDTHAHFADARYKENVVSFPPESVADLIQNLHLSHGTTGTGKAKFLEFLIYPPR